MQRALKQFPSLTLYFRSESESQARFIRLQKAFNDPVSEVYLMFFHSVLPCFTHCNPFFAKRRATDSCPAASIDEATKESAWKICQARDYFTSLKGDGLSSLQFKTTLTTSLW